MIYGSLVSSIDPVATLSILGSMGVLDTNTLCVIVFGESILNDGVSIAMFDSLVAHFRFWMDCPVSTGRLFGSLPNTFVESRLYPLQLV